jgi:hypothetical protein
MAAQRVAFRAVVRYEPTIKLVNGDRSDQLADSHKILLRRTVEYTSEHSTS